jgi:hypothetical protein
MKPSSKSAVPSSAGASSNNGFVRRSKQPMSDFNPLPTWQGFWDSFWAGCAMLAATLFFSWALARYKQAPPARQLAIFTAAEIWTGASASAAVFRFGLAAIPYGVLAMTVPMLILLVLDFLVKRETRAASPPPIPTPPPVLADALQRAAVSREERKPISLDVIPTTGSGSLTYMELRNKIKSAPLPFRRKVADGYVGAHVEWIGTLIDLTRKDDGRYRFSMHVKIEGTITGTTFFASIVYRPHIAILNEGDTLKITGTIARVSDELIVLIDPADYETV